MAFNYDEYRNPGSYDPASYDKDGNYNLNDLDFDNSKTVRTGNYKYKPRYGMNELKDIVSSAHARDIKRIDGLTTTKSAAKYLAKRGMNKYKVREEDLDGDKFPETVVYDPADNIYAINGYTTKPSDYVYRRKYYEEYPTRKVRSGKTLNHYINEYYQPSYDENGIDIHYKKDKTTDPYYIYAKKKGYKVNLPSKLSPYRAFSKFIVKPLYDYILNELASVGNGNFEDELKEIKKRLGVSGYTRVLTATYNKHIANKIIAEIQKNQQVYQGIVNDFDVINNKRDENKILVKGSEAYNKALVNYIKKRKIYKVNEGNYVRLLVGKDNRINTMNYLKNDVYATTVKVVAELGDNQDKRRTYHKEDYPEIWRIDDAKPNDAELNDDFYEIDNEA